MKFWSEIKQLVSKRDSLLFLGFYFFSTLIYYTASWISWGGFKDGHPSFFDLEEFFASAGAQFLISFFVTIPIWFFTSISLRNYPLKTRLLSHLLLLPLYIFICYYSLLWVTKTFGWAMYWGGYNAIWTIYILMLFYCVQFGFIHAYGYFMRFKKEEKEKAILRETTLKSEITALKSQLNPHFLHNLFNSINATIPPENERTRELIIKLSDLFRYQNYASQNEYVSIKEELDFLQNYLELMQVRLKERLNFTFEVSESVLNHKIAPMLLQPIVENAVNHGISPKIEPSKLVIRIQEKNDQLFIAIIDTGIGIKNKDAIFTTGLGLLNTKMRLEKIYNTSLNIEGNLPSGTKISFVI